MVDPLSKETCLILTDGHAINEIESRRFDRQTHGAYENTRARNGLPELDTMTTHLLMAQSMVAFALLRSREIETMAS
jgi:hypothetical protein